MAFTHDITGFKIHSLGVIAEDKEPDTDYVKVFLTELNSFAQGPIDEYGKQYEINYESVNNTPEKEVAESVSYVIARWLNLGNQNRNTAPNVYKGRNVLVFTYGNTNEYYWETMGREPSLQGKEHVLYTWSSNPTPNGNTEENTEDKCYYLLVSTRDNVINLVTTKLNEESVAFDVKMDLVSGSLKISDDREQYWDFDSLNGKLNVRMNEEYNVTTKKYAVTCEDFTVSATNKCSISGNGGSSYLMLNNTLTPHNFSPSTWTYDLQLVGTINQVGNLTVTGSGAFTGPVTAPNIP